MPGHERIANLAKDPTGLVTDTLSREQVNAILELWEFLHPFDKARIDYPPCHRDKVVQGRFRVSKKPCTRGVNSTKRCLLRSSGGPAQWPDCCRLVERICAHVCNRYTAPQGKTPRESPLQVESPTPALQQDPEPGHRELPVDGYDHTAAGGEQPDHPDSVVQQEKEAAEEERAPTGY